LLLLFFGVKHLFWLTVWKPHVIDTLLRGVIHQMGYIRTLLLCLKIPMGVRISVDTD